MVILNNEYNPPEKIEHFVCQICQGESKGSFIGLQASRVGPAQYYTCYECYYNQAEPQWILEFVWVFLANGNKDKVPVKFATLRTWLAGRYVGLYEFGPSTITIEDVRMMQDAYWMHLDRREISD